MIDEQTDDAIISAIKRIPVPTASKDFNSRVIENAVNSGASARAPLLPIVAGSIAASFIAWFIMASFVFGGANETSIPRIDLVEDEIKTVKLAIESESTVNDAKMTIELTDNLRLVGYENQQLLKWSTTLKQGINIISLPVSAVALGNGAITAIVQSNGKERVFKIQTRYELPDQAGYDFHSELIG